MERKRRLQEKMAKLKEEQDKLEALKNTQLKSLLEGRDYVILFSNTPRNQRQCSMRNSCSLHKMRVLCMRNSCSVYTKEHPNRCFGVTQIAIHVTRSRVWIENSEVLSSSSKFNTTPMHGWSILLPPLRRLCCLVVCLLATLLKKLMAFDEIIFSLALQWYKEQLIKLCWWSVLHFWQCRIGVPWWKSALLECFSSLLLSLLNQDHIIHLLQILDMSYPFSFDKKGRNKMGLILPFNTNYSAIFFLLLFLLLLLLTWIIWCRTWYQTCDWFKVIYFWNWLKIVRYWDWLKVVQG